MRAALCLAVLVAAAWVVPAGAAPTLTLHVSRALISFGQRVTLSGTVSNHRAGETVIVYEKPYPQLDLIERARVLTSTGGEFSLVVEPQALTSYTVEWGSLSASSPTIRVAPRLTLVRRGGWLVRVATGVSLAGRAVQVQRLNRSGTWVTLQTVTLNGRTAVRAELKLPKGWSRLRAAISADQAGPAYVATTSAVVAWRRP